MTLEEKIRYGYLAESLEEMLKLTKNTHFYEDCAMQSASFHRIERDLEKRLISYQDADLTKNRITQALLSILGRYEKEYGKASSNTSEKSTNLEEFKRSLLEKLDEEGFLAIAEVMSQIKNSPFEYNKPTFANLNQQGLSKLTALDPVPFIGQLQVFIGTLKPKK